MKVRVAVTTAAVSVAVLAGSGRAVAQAPPVPAPAPAPGTQVILPPLAPSTATLPDAAGPALPMHAGHPCYGQTDNPHNSTHYPGFALVSSRTVCAPHAATITVYLFRMVFGAWYFLDAGGPVTKVGTAQTNARWRCPSGSSQHFRGDGYHSAVGHASTTTSNEATFTCR